MCLHKRNSFVHFAFTLYLIQGGFNMGRVAPDITRSYTQNHQILDNNHNGFVNKSITTRTSITYANAKYVTSKKKRQPPMC